MFPDEDDIAEPADLQADEKYYLREPREILQVLRGMIEKRALITAYIPEGTFKRFLAFLKDLITFCVTCLFLYYGYDFFMFGFRGPLGTGIALPMTTVWRIPLWTSYLAIFTGLFFMVWYFGVAMLQSAKALLKGENA